MLDIAASGLDDEAGAVRVNGRWSIAEIVEHLDRTYTGTTKGFQRCLDLGTPRASAATLVSRTRKLVVVTLGFFPTGVEAPRHVLPSGQVALSAVMAGVRENLAVLDRTAGAVEARWGRQPVLDHPILGPFSIADWMRFHEVHTRHHRQQILARRGGDRRA